MVAEVLAFSGLLSKPTKEGWIYSSLSLGWNFHMALCPWITTSKTDRFHTNFALLGDEQRAILANKKTDSEQAGNIVLICNHTSFLDTPQVPRC